MLFINKLFNSIAFLLYFINLQLVIPGRTWILLYLGRTVYKRLWACLALYLNRFEFSGLGAPKSVDIPKLIIHIVHVNTTKHDPKCGFKFTTSTRDNYPCYLLSSNAEFAGQVHFKTHPFDIKKTRTPHKKKKQFVLSKPKQIT